MKENDRQLSKILTRTVASISIPLLIACGSGESNASDSINNGRNLNETPMPSLTVALESTATPTLEPTATPRPPEPTATPAPSTEQLMLLHANKGLKPAFQIGNVGNVITKPDSGGGVDYTAKSQIDGKSATLNQINNPDGSTQSRYILIEGIQIPDVNGNPQLIPSAISQEIRKYFNGDVSTLIRKSRPDGTELYDAVTADNPDGSYYTLSAYGFHQRGATASTVGVTYCLITPSAPHYSASPEGRTCFK